MILTLTADAGSDNWRAVGLTGRLEEAINEKTLAYMSLRHLRYKVLEVIGDYPIDYKSTVLGIFEPNADLADKYKDYFILSGQKTANEPEEEKRGRIKGKY